MAREWHQQLYIFALRLYRRVRTHGFRYERPRRLLPPVRQVPSDTPTKALDFATPIGCRCKFASCRQVRRYTRQLSSTTFINAQGLHHRRWGRERSRDPLREPSRVRSRWKRTRRWALSDCRKNKGFPRPKFPPLNPGQIALISRGKLGSVPWVS